VGETGQTAANPATTVKSPPPSLRASRWVYGERVGRIQQDGGVGSPSHTPGLNPYILERTLFDASTAERAIQRTARTSHGETGVQGGEG